MDRDPVRHQLDLLNRGLVLIGLSLTEQQQSQFGGYLSALLNASSQINLLSRGDTARIAERHLLECLAWLPRFERKITAPVLDLGSGAGFPGIPLAILRPELSVVLVESIAKKARFLDRVVAEQNLNARVYCERAERLGVSHHGSYGAVLARAVAPVRKLLRWAGPLLAPAAPLLTFKGDVLDDEIAALRLYAKPLIWGVEAVRVPKNLDGEPDWQTRQVLWIRNPKETRTI